MYRVLVLLVIFQCTECLPKGNAKQFLQPIPGYVPVYIRQGDTPLEDINQDLAEAFKAYDIKHGQFDIRKITGNEEEEKKQETLDIVNKIVPDKKDHRLPKKIYRVSASDYQGQIPVGIQTDFNQDVSMIDERILRLYAKERSHIGKSLSGSDF